MVKKAGLLGFTVLVSTAVYTSTVIPKHSFETIWPRYRLVVHASLPLTSQVNIHQRQDLRRDILDRVWERMSLDFENIVIDNETLIKDLLGNNRSFAAEYSRFFQNLTVGSIALNRGALSTKITIPLRGKSSLLEILPMPWASERYLKLTTPDYAGDFYETREAGGEYPQSLAPVIYTGLVIDVRDQKFNPSFAPRIFSPDGRLLYGPEFLSQNAGVTRGVAGFTTNLVQRESTLRAGRSPLLAVSMATLGENSTDAVISSVDARRLFDHKETVKNLLGCRVVFLYDPAKSDRNSLHD